MDADIVTAEFDQLRPQIRSYLARLVVRPEVAEELGQDVFVRAWQSLDSLPTTTNGRRAWLFRVASNAAIDELRRHGRWRESLLLDARTEAEHDPVFTQLSSGMRSTPETEAIAYEHLAVCFCCVLRNVPEQQAAALLLKEVYQFSTEEVAGILDASFGQAKNWLQSARLAMETKYAETCALITKNGVCNQCVELGVYFNGVARDPLAETPRTLDARLAILRRLTDQPTNRWHRELIALIDRTFGE
jgi:RNA polymerase sigma-70 factor (ECF subfamily)